MTSNRGALEPHSERERQIIELLRKHLALNLPATYDERIVDSWVRRFGGLTASRSRINWDLTKWPSEGVIRFSVDLTSATDFDKLASIGWVQPPWVGLRGGFRDSHKRRAMWPDGSRVAATLAAFYLSRSGGGTRERQAAWDLLCAQVPEVSAESMSEYHKLLREIRQLFGPVTARNDEAA